MSVRSLVALTLVALVVYIAVVESKAVDDPALTTTAHPKPRPTLRVKTNSGKPKDNAEAANTGFADPGAKEADPKDPSLDHKPKHTDKRPKDKLEHDKADKEKAHKGHGKWGYFGDTAPGHWGTLPGFGLCGKASMRQSPINIDTLNVQYKDELNDIDIYTKDENDTYHMMIANDGHKVLINVDAELFISRGGLPEVFKVAGMHFHWGAEDDKGSEHTVDGTAYPLELHVVTYDSNNYGNVHDALAGQDSLAVLGTFFEIDEDDNPALEPIISTFDTIRAPKNELETIPMVPLKDLLPKSCESYYRYKGSLTTPGCFQNVIWTVFDSKSYISRRQMAQFRSLHRNLDGEPLVDNFRPVQDLYNRTVHSSFFPVKKVAFYENAKEVKGQATVTKVANLVVISLLLAILAVKL